MTVQINDIPTQPSIRTSDVTNPEFKQAILGKRFAYLSPDEDSRKEGCYLFRLPEGFVARVSSSNLNTVERLDTLDQDLAKRNYAQDLLSKLNEAGII